jgi:putative ABC transport system substrate-binding protein
VREKSLIGNLVWLLTGLLLASPHLGKAQQPKKIPRIGYLTGVGSAPNEAFLQGLRDLGYFEGKNILIEFRREANLSASPNLRPSSSG